MGARSNQNDDNIILSTYPLIIFIDRRDEEYFPLDIEY